MSVLWDGTQVAKFSLTSAIADITDTFTIMGWCRMTGGADERNIFGFDQGGNLYVVYVNTGADTLTLYDGSSTTGSNLVDNVWRHITFVQGNSGVAVQFFAYLDGVLNITGNTDFPSAAAADLYISQLTTVGSGFEGEIAGVKIWDGAALSTAEMLIEMNSETPVRTANLVAWYPFTRANGATTDIDLRNHWGGAGALGTLTKTGTSMVPGDNPPVARGWHGFQYGLTAPSASDPATEIPHTTPILPDISPMNVVSY